MHLTRPEGTEASDLHLTRRAAVGSMFFAGYALAALDANAAPITTAADDLIIEEALIASDLGPGMAARTRARLANGSFERNLEELGIRLIVADEIEQALAPVAHPLVRRPDARPHVILVLGVNGSGKTTTIAKLAHRFTNEGQRVMLAAGDTFRAAAIG